MASLPPSSSSSLATSPPSSHVASTAERENLQRFKDGLHDPNLAWFYQPHTITALVFSLAILIYVAFTRGEGTWEANAKIGIVAACLIFLLFSMVQMRDGLFTRPHPAFWRVIMGCGVLYLLGMVFLLFQTADDARQMLKYFDPVLGVPLPERSYGDDCRFYIPDDPNPFRNVIDTIRDEFFIAHLLGWWAKMVILRDVTICWILSILFEVMEISLKAYLPNFNECWWDQVILDILICNWLGIVLGSFTCRWLQVKEYHWAGGPKTAFTQFLPLPQSFETYNWAILENPKRYFYFLGLIVVWTIVELNVFFLKFELWIPPPHPIMLARLALWFGIALPACREYFQFISDPTCKRFGAMVWLAIANCIVEVLICIKFGKGMFPEPIPYETKRNWLIFLTVFISASVLYFSFKKSPQEPHSSTQLTSTPQTIQTQASKKRQ